MAQKNIFQHHTIYSISSPDGHTRASFVPKKGGVAHSMLLPWKDSSREILFLHNNFWEANSLDLQGGWPLLFPICGRLECDGQPGAYRYAEHLYNMPIHGFSPYLPWEVTHSNKPNELTMELSDNTETLKMYPFRFHVSVRYTAENGYLWCTHTYTNTHNKPLPYYAGLHPYFLTPPATAGKAKVTADFAPIKRLHYNANLTAVIGEQDLPSFPISVADPALNEQLFTVSPNNTVALHYPDGFALYMHCPADMFPYLQAYTIPEKPFICMEPWMGIPNALNTQQGIRWLAPGQRETAVVTLSCNNNHMEIHCT